MINIDKVSKYNKNYKYKILVSFFIFSIIVLFTIIVVHIEFSKDNQLKKFEIESHLQAEEKTIFLDTFLEKRKDSLIAVRNNPYFRELIENGTYKHNTDFLFFTIMQENKDFMQLRFLDLKGKETLRFDRDIYGQTAYKVANLQNKQKRYYFQKTISMKDNEVFFSKIDFNMEKGKIQEPFIPVLRVATPVYINKNLQGILIINLFIDNFMKLLTSSPIYDISIVDEDGHLVKTKTKYFNQDISLNKIFDDETAQQILETKDSTTIFDKNIFVKRYTISNKIMFIIYKAKTQILKDIKENDIKMTLIILLITIFISIPFALLLSRPINKMFEIVVLQGDKLHEIATTLDEKVEEETLKNAKKDRLLQHQSKLAELGDMIGNIAHQWRHPLTRLSLLLQNLKLYKKKNKMNDEIFFNTLEKVDEQIEFMSDTIDNFKDFYKTNKIKNNFTIEKCLNDILNIIGTVLEHNNIEVIIKNDDIEIYGIQNQFSQVLLNLIVNAKDALVEKKIKQPIITIKIYQENSHKIISIEDNAGGIPSDIIDDIFDPYFTTKDKQGTGIGLYLSRTIIEDEMKGKLNCANLNNGAIFKITL